MFENSTPSDFQPIPETTANPREASSAPPTNFAEPSPEIPATSSELALVEIGPKSAKEIGDLYKKTDKTVQNWFSRAICPAYCWLQPTDLQVGSSNQLRYTPLCQQLIADYRASGLSADQWIAHIHAANPDRVAAAAPPAPTPEHEEKVPLSDTEIVPYNRSQQIDQYLSSRPIPLAVAPNPNENPVLLALQERLKQLAASSQQAQGQISQLQVAQADTMQVIDTLEDLEVVAKARAKAERHYSLEQQIYREHLDAMKAETVVGKPPASAQSSSV